MKRFSEQLNKKAMSVKLRAAEKRELRERVVSYMEYHPLPKEMQAKKVLDTPALMTEPYKTVAVPWKAMTQWAVGAFALVMIMVPFAAERSVPGDGLYAVKRFNEEVRGTLAFDTVQKVEWETERLNRRIAEARLLASEGRLTDEVEAEVAAAVRTHSENAQKNIELLRGEDEDEATLASIALETTLTVQSAALNDEAAGDESGSEEVPSILAVAVAKELEETNATNETATIPAFDKVMAKVEMNTTRVYELRDSLVETATDEQIIEITRRIEDIERSVVKALTLREENDEEARAILVDSLQRTQKLIVFMTDIEVSQTVDIETIVPVVLTDEEENSILLAYQADLDGKMAEINEALPEVEDEPLVEKANAVLGEVDVILADFSTSTSFAVAEETLTSALDLVNNVYVILELDAKADPIVEVPVDETASSTDETASSTEEVIEEEEIEEVEESEDEAAEEETTEPEEEVVEESPEETDTTEEVPVERVATSTDSDIVNVDTE